MPYHQPFRRAGRERGHLETRTMGSGTMKLDCDTAATGSDAKGPECRTTRLEAQPIVGIRSTAPMSELGNVMGELFGEVHGYVQGNGGEIAGMPLAIYHSPPGETIDFECAIPVASPMAGAGRVQAGELPAGTAATVTHLGPYDGLGATWSVLTAWMESEDLEGAGAPWEVYQTDPGAEPDPSRWRTDIFFPVR